MQNLQFQWRRWNSTQCEKEITEISDCEHKKTSDGVWNIGVSVKYFQPLDNPFNTVVSKKEDVHQRKCLKAVNCFSTEKFMKRLSNCFFREITD